MPEYKEVGISIKENGYVVTVLETDKSFVFETAEKMVEWLDENLKLTGEVERFSDALDDESKDQATVENTTFVGYNTIGG